MRIEKTTRFFKKMKILDRIQYFIGVFIGILFVLGLIPFTFDKLYVLIKGLIIIQIIISLVRLRILNVILEIFILGLAFLSLIPLLGYLFRIVGLIMSILDFSSFKNYKIFKKVEIKKYYPNKYKNKLKSTNFKEAEFKEK